MISEKPTWEQIEAERLRFWAWCKEREEKVIRDVLGRIWPTGTLGARRRAGG